MDIISSEQLRKLKKIKPFGHSEASKKKIRQILLIFPVLGKMTHIWVLRPPMWAVVCSHWLHLRVLSPVCVVKCILKLLCWGVVVSNFSDNLISYSDCHQTKGFTTFRYLEPPKLMVWKSDIFRGPMRFVRVPPYEKKAKLTNFYFSWENGAILLSGKCCPLFHSKHCQRHNGPRNWLRDLD